jgi:quercetin dioxygenase-like cupin family protein
MLSHNIPGFPERLFCVWSSNKILTGDTIKSSSIKTQQIVIALASVATIALFVAAAPQLAGEEIVKPVFSEELSNAPGQTLAVVTVNYSPGGKSGAHHHAGSVLAYVLSGAIRSENSATGPIKVYKAGESFFEPQGSKHLISENASATEPATLLVVFVAEDGAQLTTSDVK